MKILHVLYSGLGGHSNVFFSMVKADEKKEFDYEAIFNGVEEVRKDYITNCNANNIPWQFLKKTPGTHLSFFWRIFKAIRASKADIIFLHGSLYALPARLAILFSSKSKKIIVRETQANHLKTKNEWRALKIAMLMADKVVFLSHEYVTEVEKELGSNFKQKKSVVIPNGLDITFYKPAAAAKQHKPAILGMQSRLVPIKDHATLLKAFALVKASSQEEIILKIAGDGVSRKELENLSASLELEKNVFFTGMLNEDELLAFLQSLDIYIHASLGETMSTAIMQAMACALPIIASDVPGINNMIENNVTGILVPHKNVEKMAEAILKLIRNPALTNQLSVNSLYNAKAKFSSGKMFKEYTILFKEKL
ncbi:MAG: glycosyltransferase family 4 protein [Ferruginibacter sp.]